MLIQGETGSGKELCARAIHSQSKRAAGPFVVCDLAAVAPTLAAAELFGHTKGSFTGATKDRRGLVEQADGGTLFLDEVGDFGLELQPSLLRVLEQHEVRRVGETAYRKVDLRVVAATHKDLENEVKAGRFREDLYHRIAVATVRFVRRCASAAKTSPLLVDELLVAKLGKAKGTDVARRRARCCSRTRGPGNVRELRNVVERAVGLGDIGQQEAERAADLQGVEGPAHRRVRASRFSARPHAPKRRQHLARPRAMQEWIACTCTAC